MARALLRDVEERHANALLCQFSTPGRIRREVSGGRLEVTVESTTEDLLVDLESDVCGPEVEFTDLLSGRAMFFTVTLRRGGFFGSLIGRVNGRWPRRWKVDPAEVAPSEGIANRLEVGRVADPAALGRFLRVPVEAVRQATLREAATGEAILETERRESAQLPEDARELLSISDGLIVRDLVVMGTRDLFVVDLGDGIERWLLASDGTGAQYLYSEAGIVSVPDNVSDLSDLRFVAQSARAWLAEEVSKGPST